MPESESPPSVPAKLTIVVINHNYGQFLNAAIDSALAQSHPADQVVVVDDGSTDNSRAIIEAYGDRITTVFKVAGGHVTAVNAGYALARGDLCIFLDADDVLYPRCVETVLRSWRTGDVKLQYRLDTIDQDGVNQHMPFPHFPADLTPASVRAQAYQFGVYPWTVSTGNAFSRLLLDALLPIDVAEIYRSPDGYINKMAPLLGDVRSINDVLGAYRVHRSNAWAQNAHELRVEPILRWLEFDKVLQRNFEAAAKRRGVTVTPYVDIKTLQKMEYRLLARRFAPGQFEPQTAAWKIFKQGVSAAYVAPNISEFGRALWMAWLFVMAFLPRPVVRTVFAMARGQNGRSKVSRLLVRISHGRAKVKAVHGAGGDLPRIAVVVATLGRPDEVAQLLERLARQTYAPEVIVLSVESSADLPSALPNAVRVVRGSRGAAVQRNLGIEAVKEYCDVIIFFDDDFLPCDFSLRGAAVLFRDHPDVVGATGQVLADGIGKGGIGFDRSMDIVSEAENRPYEPRIERNLRTAYGCNMAFRVAAIGDIRFDENLPLYSWQEDVDFAAQLSRRGRVVRTNAFAGVHRGVTRGRTSGLRFGFSQMVNPVYLVRKGTMHPGHAAQLMARNLIANHVKALWSEPWIDRRGRLRGNWIGLRRILKGEIDPRQVSDL